MNKVNDEDAVDLGKTIRDKLASRAQTARLMGQSGRAGPSLTFSFGFFQYPVFICQSNFS